MKESDYLDLMNGLDARYADETVRRLSGDTEFEAISVTAENRTIRRNRRLFAGVMTAAAAAACVFSVTVLLLRLRRNPEVITPAAAHSDTEPVYEVDLPTSVTNLEHTDAVEETRKADGTTTKAVVMQPDLKSRQGKVLFQNNNSGPTELTEEQSAHIKQLMSSAKLVRINEPDEVWFGGYASHNTITIIISNVKSEDADYSWTFYGDSIVYIDGVFYQNKTADTLHQIIQYGSYCVSINNQEQPFVIHLPEGFSGNSLIYTIPCAQNPAVLSNQDSGFIIQKMTEAKLSEIPVYDLPDGGPITVELEGAGIRWDIYSDTVVMIDGKFYEDSTDTLKEIEIYALGFLG